MPPQSLHLDILSQSSEPAPVEPGAVITFTYNLFNSEMGSHPIIFYATVPEDTLFLNVQGGAYPISYTLNLRAPDTTTVYTGTGSLIPPENVKAILFTGGLEALKSITLTVQVLPGSKAVTRSRILPDGFYGLKKVNRIVY